MLYNKFRVSVNYINLFAAVLVASSLIFWESMQKPAIYLFCISYLIEFFTDKKWKTLKFSNKAYWCIAVFVFYILAYIYKPFESTSNYFSIVINNRSSLLVSVFVVLFGVNNLFKMTYFLNTFILTSILAILYLALYRVGVSDLINNESRFDLFNSARIQWINSHTIFNYYLNISIVFIWYILTFSWNKIKGWQRFFYLTATALIFFSITISEGRSGFLTGIILFVGYIIFYFFKRNKKVGILIALLTPLFVVGLASQKERFSNQALQNEPRLILWKTAFDIVKTAPILGHGISDPQNKFMESLSTNQSKEFIVANQNNKILDAHNQYLQTLMEFGITGLILLVFIYIFPILLVEKKLKIVTIYLIATILFQSFFDVFFTGIFSHFFAFLMILILVVPNNLTADGSLYKGEAVKKA